MFPAASFPLLKPAANDPVACDAKNADDAMIARLLPRQIKCEAQRVRCTISSVPLLLYFVSLHTLVSPFSLLNNRIGTRFNETVRTVKSYNY